MINFRIYDQVALRVYQRKSNNGTNKKGFSIDSIMK